MTLGLIGVHRLEESCVAMDNRLRHEVIHQNCSFHVIVLDTGLAGRGWLDSLGVHYEVVELRRLSNSELKGLK